MIGLIRFTLALAAIVLIAPALAQAAEQVDLLLVLASDVSRSVDHPKFLLQREGYATAISIRMCWMPSGPVRTSVLRCALSNGRALARRSW